MVLLCYFCAFWVCASPWDPMGSTMSVTQLYIGMVILGTPLAAIGIWLNHLADKHVKKP